MRFPPPVVPPTNYPYTPTDASFITPSSPVLSNVGAINSNGKLVKKVQLSDADKATLRAIDFARLVSFGIVFEDPEPFWAASQ